MRKALRWIKEKNWGTMVFESDYIGVIHAIRSPLRVMSQFREVIHGAKICWIVLNICRCFLSNGPLTKSPMLLLGKLVI